jgi:hypothetical protein
MVFNGEGESCGAMGEYSDDHPPAEDFAMNVVEMLDPVVYDDQLQQQFSEDDLSPDTGFIAVRNFDMARLS